MGVSTPLRTIILYGIPAISRNIFKPYSFIAFACEWSLDRMSATQHNWTYVILRSASQKQEPSILHGIDKTCSSQRQYRAVLVHEEEHGVGEPGQHRCGFTHAVQ
jgi:hypothetical protein